MAMAMAMAARMRQVIVQTSQAKAVLVKSPPLIFNLRRGFCDAPASNVALIKSECDFKSALKRVQDDAVPALFYYTAVWCGPCKFMSPIVESLSKQHPHVTTYKVDIDQEEVANILSGLDITAVPTFDFYKNGKKVDRVLGADEKRLKTIMETLYN